MDWFQTIALALVLLFLFSWLTGSKPRRLPPGPQGLPLFGYLPFLGQAQHVTLTNLGKKYGGVFTVPLFKHDAVVLNDWPAIKEALAHQAHAFSGRPSMLFTDEAVNNSDISFSNGIGWRERRQFTMRHLKDFIFSHKSMEGVIMEEVHKILEHLESVDQRKVDVGDLFFFSMLNIAWSFVGGSRFDYNDQHMMELMQTMDTIFKGLSNLNLANFIPVLRHLPSSGFQEYMRANEKLYAFVKKEIEAHKDTFQEGHARDFIDAYLAEISKHQELKSPSWSRAFQEKHLMAVLWDLFLAGIDTTSSTLLWGLLYMITWPDIQRKVQQEMDDVVGRARLPTSKDITMLPYTGAVLLEVQRLASIVPLSLMHYTQAPATVRGYSIPKSTVILENLWAVHHDPELWGDPEVFRPERFLNAKGQVQKPEYLIPFSLGSRVCIGKSLARMEMFEFFACLLHRFTFSNVTGEKPPSLEPRIRLVLKPWPFSMTIKQR